VTDSPGFPPDSTRRRSGCGLAPYELVFSIAQGGGFVKGFAGFIAFFYSQGAVSSV